MRTTKRVSAARAERGSKAGEHGKGPAAEVAIELG